MPTLKRTAITNKVNVNMFNFKTIGKFNGSRFDKLTSHPAIEESCYMKFCKLICATY
nr:MAG TPA: hypothetical protein [Caudoviricetes sp.]